MKATALRTAPPAMIATLAILYVHFWEDFLILKVFFQSDGCSHHSHGELHVVHGIACWGQQLKFSLTAFFATQLIGIDCSIENSFDELVVR